MIPGLCVCLGIDLGKEPVPDETTICKFRHLMEKNNLGGELFLPRECVFGRKWFKGLTRHDCRCHDH